MNAQNLTIESLLAGYQARRFTPREVIESLLARLDAATARNVWISRLSRETVLARAAALGEWRESLPLYGVPFAIKDNIDLAGSVTTAACPAYAYSPSRSATVVEKLLAAGAIPIGKTNLDQFATGLVGVRSPYGACANSFDARFIAGGSSSGSAVAVASGLVSFALGTDTAGSGRVPAAFNNLVGLKPSCGLLSTRGVVPACRTLDCVSIFALTSEDAARVLAVARGFDREDGYSRDFAASSRRPLESPRVGVPRRDQLEFCGDRDYAGMFTAACARATALGWQIVEIDFAPFFETARLLYEGPWVAERYAVAGALIERQPEALLDVTRTIISAGRTPPAVDAFRAQYRLRELQRVASCAWQDVDLLMTPTAPTIYTLDAVLADPIRLNATLGWYTNFVNLLDLAAIAVPAGFRSDGLPGGVTLLGAAGSDAALLDYGARLHRAAQLSLGATGLPMPDAREASSTPGDCIDIAVCGAHMCGLPLNHQLTDREARFQRATRTASRYRLYALPGGPPARPGLVRVASGGAAIEVEVWSLPLEHAGSFLAGIPSPLAIGKVELEDGTLCAGFVCEGWGVEAATDITGYRGWRNYLAKRPSPIPDPPSPSKKD